MTKNLLVKLSLIVIFLLCSFLSTSNSILKQGNLSKEMTVFAQEELYENYKIYDEDYNFLFEREGVEIGDNYLSKDFKFYEVISLDNNTHAGIAKFIKQMQAPNVSKSDLPTPIKVERRVIAMYMTHNDESYVPSDGVDSIYGNGGIKDVALSFKSELEKNFVDVYFDDSLHIPHNSQAYSRSLKTAQNLQNTYAPDAIFDIHRDGASRGYYIANVDGKERGKVRIVVGKANPNMKLNEEFATYLMAVGNELYPWLFTDIYYAKGHYNQALDSKAILFEMGSHLVEKELMQQSMKELSDVVTTALYKTTVNNTNGDLTINGTESERELTVNETLNKKESAKTGLFIFCVTIVILASVCTTIFFVIWKKYRENINKNKEIKK
mgnify:CR=1 FL=1